MLWLGPTLPTLPTFPTLDDRYDNRTVSTLPPLVAREVALGGCTDELLWRTRSSALRLTTSSVEWAEAEGGLDHEHQELDPLPSELFDGFSDPYADEGGLEPRAGVEATAGPLIRTDVSCFLSPPGSEGVFANAAAAAAARPWSAGHARAPTLLLTPCVRMSCAEPPILPPPRDRTSSARSESALQRYNEGPAKDGLVQFFRLLEDLTLSEEERAKVLRALDTALLAPKLKKICKALRPPDEKLVLNASGQLEDPVTCDSLCSALRLPLFAGCQSGETGRGFCNRHAKRVAGEFLTLEKEVLDYFGAQGAAPAARFGAGTDTLP